MNSFRNSAFLAGARDIFPLIVGAVPFGIIFGTLSVRAGLSLVETMALSIVVFAGSAQFIAVGLFAAGTPWQIVLLTTFVVNLRHMLYSAAVAPRTKHLSPAIKAGMAFLLTDEAFAVAAPRLSGEEYGDFTGYYFGAALFMYVNWQICSLVGALFGNLIPGAASWGLDFAMPVTFIGMPVPYLRNLPMVAAASCAGIAALLCFPLPNKLWIVTAAAVGIAAGLAVEAAAKAARGGRGGNA